MIEFHWREEKRSDMMFEQLFLLTFLGRTTCIATLRFYPAALDSQPPPPSPMDFSYEFLMFQRGTHDTTEKLEYYENLIMTLLGELKTLRETMCSSCLRQCTSSKTTRSVNPISTESTIALRLPNLRHVIPTLPRMPKMKPFWRTSDPGSSNMSANTTVASVSSPLVEIPTDESDNAIFYVERDALADTTLDVTFVHSFRRQNMVFCVCFSRDGEYMAVGTGYSSVLIYEVESHKKYCELREYASQYGSYARPDPLNLCFSSDGRYLAVTDRVERIIIWDVAKKRIRSVFHGKARYEIRFSPDGRLVACRTGVGLLVLNVRDNSRRMECKGDCFDFNSNGRYIAIGNNGVLVILDVRTGKMMKRWNGHGGSLRCVKFTPDGRGLWYVYNDMIQQWDVSDAEPVLIRKFDVPYSYFFQASISPDHRLVALDNQLWDVDSGKRRYTLKGHEVIYSVDFSAAGTYLTIGSWDGFVSLWKYTGT